MSKTEESKPDDAKNVDNIDVVAVDENKKSDQPENPTSSQTTSAISTSSSSPPVNAVAQDRERTKKDEQVIVRQVV